MFIDELKEKARLGRGLTQSEMGTIASMNMSSMAVTIVAIGVVIGVLLIVLMIFKNIGLMIAMFPLFGLALVLALATIVFVKVKKYSMIRAVAAGIAVGVACFMGAREIYDSGNRHYPSGYCGDYIRKLPDGSPPRFTTKRDGRGDELPALTPGQWVRVNGISYKENQYNITTWDGTTGWVEGTAFPQDGAQWLFDRFGTGGAINREVAKDRQVEWYAEKYLTTEPGNKMLPDTRGRTVHIGAQTPYRVLSRETFKETGDTLFVDSNVTLTLESIVYANECTMMHLSVNYTDNSSEYQPLPETFEALQVKDLDTGETFNVLPASYGRWSWMDGSGSQVNRTHAVFMFWPFKSRHFSLTHTAHPQLDAHGGGWMAKLARTVSFGSELERNYFADWNFEEVNVR